MTQSATARRPANASPSTVRWGGTTLPKLFRAPPKTDSCSQSFTRRNGRPLGTARHTPSVYCTSPLSAIPLRFHTFLSFTFDAEKTHLVYLTLLLGHRAGNSYCRQEKRDHRSIQPALNRPCLPIHCFESVTHSVDFLIAIPTPEFPIPTRQWLTQPIFE